MFSCRANITGLLLHYQSKTNQRCLFQKQDNNCFLSLPDYLPHILLPYKFCKKLYLLTLKLNFMETMINCITKTIMVVIAVVMLSFSNAPVVTNEIENNNVAELQYLGKVKNLPVFRLVITNAALSVFYINVKDDNGEIIYTETLRGNSITRTYQLNTENMDMVNGTSFELVNSTNNLTTVYKIKQVTKNVEEMIVTKTR
jgi:hypothetical protein